MRAAPMLSAVAFASSTPFSCSAATMVPPSVLAFASCIKGGVRESRYRRATTTVFQCLEASSSMRGPTQLPRRNIRSCSSSSSSSGSSSVSSSGFVVALRAHRSNGNGGGGGVGGSSNGARGFFTSGQSARSRPGWAIQSVMSSSPTTATRGQQRLGFRQRHQQQLSRVQHRHTNPPFSTIGVATGTALGSAGGSVGGSLGGGRGYRGASSAYNRGCGPLMASVTDKDIMREFATIAAEAASSPQSPGDVASSGEGAGAGQEVQQQVAQARAGVVDDERPTGYKYGDVLTDEDGLPLVYDSDSIGRYWDKRPGELNSRWTKFLSVTVPFVTRVVKDYTSGNIMKNEGELARDLRIVIEKLGPTFIKLGQALSIRPDVIGPAATDELAKLQDAVPPFPTPLAMELLEEELARPPSEVFSEISEDPIASASLAQVYRGVLKSDGRAVAIKIQRPGLVQAVTKDLYVLKRAVGVYQKLSDRWTAQMTNYNELLRVWATGFYQELDFLNEANNQIRMKGVLSSMEGEVFVPDVVLELSTRRVLVSEWVDGVKLTKADPFEIRELTSIAQEAFLVQLLGEGFMHCDPHPGNMLLIDESMRAERGKLALLDFGLMAELGAREREGMVSALIHTANRDYKALIEDLVVLEVLPADTDRGQVEPIMKRVIGPYVFEGGGAKSLNYQSLAKDLGRATLEIPFNIPPYFALIARALGILEGVALTGDPDYRIVMEAYPFVTRKIISDDSPALQRALRDILYSEDGKFLAKRLSVLLSYATGVIAADSSVFVDFDTLPESGASLGQTLKFLLAEEARPLRAALVGEASNAADLVLRRATRQAVVRAKDVLRPPPPPLPFLPRLPALPFPVPKSVVDALSPPLTVEEDIFLASLEELAYALSGLQPGTVQEDPIKALRQLLQGGDGGAGELAEFVQTLPGDAQKTGALLEVGSEVVQSLAGKASERLNGLVTSGSGPRERSRATSGDDASETSTGGDTRR